MNEAHLEFCASPEWREIVEEMVIPAAIGTRQLGEDVVEVGPGPGFTTDVLRSRAERVTAVEINAGLAAGLGARLAGTNAAVIRGDGAAMSLPARRFSGAGSFNMLHHVPTAEAQDRIFAEVARVLAPGGLFVATDALPRDDLDAFHEGDTFNPIDPDDLPDRLAQAGFTQIELDEYELGWTCSARAPTA